jgi:hypothetical protein
MTRGQKLELTWVGKDRQPRLELRILLNDGDKSYQAQCRVAPLWHGRFKMHRFLPGGRRESDVVETHI